MFVTLCVALTLLTWSTKIVYWAPALCKAVSAAGPQVTKAESHTVLSIVQHAACHTAQQPASWVSASSSSAPVPAQQEPFLINFCTSNTWHTIVVQKMLVDKMHEGGGIHSAVQPLSTLFTIFFFLAPLHSLWDPTYPTSDQNRPLAVTAGVPTPGPPGPHHWPFEVLKWIVSVNSLPTWTFSRHFRWLTLKALCKYVSKLGIERFFCYLGLRKKNLQIPDGWSHIKQSTVCNITFSFTYQGSCLILESEAQQY